MLCVWHVHAVDLMKARDGSVQLDLKRDAYKIS